MPTNVLLRSFQPSDQAQARELIESGLGEHFGHIDRNANPDIVNIHKSYALSGHDFVVAVQNRQIIGTCGLFLVSDQPPRMVRLSVHPQWRRTGIAGQLLDTCVTRASQKGFQELIAYTEPHWENAVGFYQNRGFVQYGQDEEDIYLMLRW